MRLDQEDFDQATKKKATLLEQLELFGAEAPSQISQAIQRADTLIATKAQRINDANVNRNIGEVFFGTGYKLDGDAQCQLDYGLIEMYPARAGTNEVGIMLPLSALTTQVICLQEWCLIDTR